MKALIAFALLRVLVVLSACGGDASSEGASETDEAAESELPLESSEGTGDVGGIEDEPNSVGETEPSRPSYEVRGGLVGCFQLAAPSYRAEPRGPARRVRRRSGPQTPARVVLHRSVDVALLSRPVTLVGEWVNRSAG
jgi:hypothetical protein